MRTPLFIAGLLLNHLLFAQNPTQQTYHINVSDGARKNYIVIDPPSVKSSPLFSSDEVRVIVQFQSSPIGNVQGRARVDAIQTEHQQFKNNFTRLSGNSISGRTTNSTTPIVHHEFITVYNGFAITTTQSVADQIRQLPYVAQVIEDRKVKTNYSDNNNAIYAPQAWQQFDATGKNITIGIIDTGIDYNHPDLGQGIGAGFKVVGGYDFVNGDNDPMDDHGHGTHVAGIAAANGVSFKGVAPDAKLMAYKVLTSEGWGYDSWIMAAIERSADPDQNPNTDDALDVVSMSLGRAPVANDPMAEAVNNAVAKGIVFTIAAGNDYDYFTVGSPGIAEKAITVAAVDNNGFTAPFSSKGPVAGTLALKPDVAAPGVDINSTFPNQQYESLSGTSMATPHVAGAAALILEKHPDWTPEMVKGALMNSANPSMALNAWDQGAGMINVLEALKVNSVAVPGSINFGSMNSEPTFSRTSTLTIQNTTTQRKTFNLTGESDLTAGVFSLMFSPSSVTLDPGQNSQIQVSISGNTADVPSRNLPEAYRGIARITSDGLTVTRVPMVFINSPKTRLHFNGELPGLIVVIGIEGSWYWKPFNPTSSDLDLYLPQGKYDIITQYGGGQYVVVTEGVQAENNSSITLSKSLAKNLVTFKPVNENGNPIDMSTDSFSSGLNWQIFGQALFSGVDRNILTWYPWSVDSLYISDQDHYGFEFRFHGKNHTTDSYYDIVAKADAGIHSNIVTGNDPAKYSHIQITNPSAANGSAQNMNFFGKMGSPYAWMTSWNYLPVEMPKTFTLHQSEYQTGSGMLGAFLNLSPANNASGYVWETSDIRSENGKILFNRHVDRNLVTLEQTEFDYVFGRTIPNFVLRPNHQEPYATYSVFLGRGAFDNAFGERSKGTITYKLSNAGGIVQQGNFAQAIFAQTESVMPQLEVAASGEYHLDFEYSDFQTGGRFGVAKVKTTFDMSRTDDEPPHIESLRLLVDGHDTNEFEVGKSGMFKLVVSDDCEWAWCDQTGVHDVSVKIKLEGESDWTTLNTTGSVYDYSSSFGSSLAVGYYDLLVTANDNSGNTFSYEVSPAFLIGERQGEEEFTTVNLLTPINNAQYVGTTPQFGWSVVEGATYVLQISKDNSFGSGVIEYASNDPNFQLVNPLDEASMYYWRVRPVKNNNNGHWSTVYSFQSNILPGAQLISPANHAVTSFGNLAFDWNGVENATYALEISYTQDFSNLSHLIFTPASVQNIGSLLPNRQYWWRVKMSVQGQSETVSDVFDFTTESILAATPLTPADGATLENLSPVFTWQSAGQPVAYTLQLSHTSDFGIISRSIDGTATGASAENLAPETTYYWRIRNYQVESGYDIYSDIFHFTTPAGPVLSLLKPADGELTSYANVTFQWTNAGAPGYKLELSRTSDFQLIEVSMLTSSTSAVVQQLASSTDYYWRVKARFDNSTEMIAGPLHLRTKEISKASLEFPGNEQQLDNTLIDFSWGAAAGATGYWLEVSRSPVFSGMDVMEYTTGLKFEHVQLEMFTEYYWRVRSLFNDSGPSVSQVFRFTTPKLAAPSLTLPEAGSNNKPLTLNFEWASVPQALNYKLEVSKNNSFATINRSLRVSQSSAEVTNLEDGVTYYWRVTTFASNNTAQSTSEVRSFTTVDLRTVDLIEPTDQSIDQPLDVKLAWTAVESTDHYNVQVSKNQLFTDLVFSANTNDTFLNMSGLEPFRTYFWRVTNVIAAGAMTYPMISSSFEFQTLITTGVEQKDDRRIYSVPNPFEKETVIVIESDVRTSASIEFMASQGVSADALEVDLNEGTNRIAWQKEIPAGVYYAIVRTAKGRTSVIRLVKI